MIHLDYESKKKLAISKSVMRQLCKYYISGGIGFVIDFSLFSTLVIFFQMIFYIANIISYFSGVIVVCYLQKNWTFHYESKSNLQLYIKYILTIFLVFIINNILLVYCIGILHINNIPAKFGQLIISSIFGYYIQKKFVFH